MNPKRFITLLLCVSATVGAVTSTAFAQPTSTVTNPVAGRVVVIVPLTGSATTELNANIESTLRGAFLSRGASVPDHDAVMVGLGMTPPTDALGWARVGRTMAASDILRGDVRPLAGQFILTLTRIDTATARSATTSSNVSDQESGRIINTMIDVLYDPANLGPSPVDPEAQARERQAQAEREAAARRREEQARAEAAARQADEARQRREREAREHPVVSFDQGGPVAISAALSLGGLLSSVHPPPVRVLSGTAPGEASSFAMALRVDGAYSLRAVRGLELVGQLGLLVSPTTAVMLGAGAQFTFPASASFPLRGVGGFLIGLFQGATGARATTVWLSPFARAEWSFSSRISAFAGLTFDIAPASDGGVTTLSFTAGARVHFGG